MDFVYIYIYAYPRGSMYPTIRYAVLDNSNCRTGLGKYMIIRYLDP